MDVLPSVPPSSVSSSNMCTNLCSHMHALVNLMTDFFKYCWFYVPIDRVSVACHRGSNKAIPNDSIIMHKKAIIPNNSMTYTS